MKLYLPIAALVLGAGIFVYGANAVSAQSNGESLIEKLTSRFNLNQEEVQAVFYEHKAQKQEQRAEKISEYLQEKVDDGSITSDQKDAIQAKLDELKNSKLELKDQDLSKEEIRTQLKELRGELESWAQEQELDLEDLLPGKKGHFRGPKQAMQGA